MTSTCILCGGKKSKKLYDVNKYKMVECSSCSFIYIVPWPTKQELDKYYKAFNYGPMMENESLVRIDARRILNNLKKLGYTKGKLLDLGCGTGFLMDEARKRGWNTLGVDMSSGSINHARKKLKLNFILQDIHKYNTTDRFDVIIFSNVIEHLTDPYIMLKKIYTFLKDDGIVVVATPNINSLLSKVLKEKFNYIKAPEHTLYFSPNTLNRMLRKSGFRVLKTLTYGYADDFGILYRYLREKSMKNKTVNNYSLKKTQVNIHAPKNKSSLQKFRSFLFEDVFRNAAYPLLNINHNGSMIETYIKKDS